MDADAIVVGHGLAGLVAAAELTDAGRRVLLVDQESEANLGGQAHWSFGGLFFVDSPEQRRLGIKDSAELAYSDWMNTAGFDRDEDHWPREWAKAYLDFAGGEKRSWLHEQGMRWFPIVGWAERGDGSAHGHGNSVPRFHITWGTGPGVVAPFARRVEEARARGQVTYAHRHRVDELIVEGGSVVGVRGVHLAEDRAERGVATNRDPKGGFELRAPVVLVASGGIGGNHDLVRENWPERLGAPPKRMVTGVPAHVDGRMIAITQEAGGRLINRDRMWHYVEGIRNWDPIWPGHGIRILPGPSSMWLDANGDRLPAPLLPGFDTLGTLAHLRRSGHDHSWFVTNRSVAGKEFALSGSEQNADLTGKDIQGVLRKRSLADVTPSMQAFLDEGADFVMADTAEELVERMNGLLEEGEPALDVAHVKRNTRHPLSDRDNVPGPVPRWKSVIDDELVSNAAYQNRKESLEAIIALWTSDEPITRETDWFTIRDGHCQLTPYTHPHPEIAVAAMVSSPTSSASSTSATASSTTPTPRTRRSRRCAWPGPTSGTRSPSVPTRRTSCRTRRRAPSSA